MRFRKRPVEIEAKQFTAETADEVAKWCGGRVDQYVKPSDYTDVYLGLSIPTLEGTMLANINDWIIKGVKGEFYPCKPDIFEETYEPVLADGGYLEVGVVTPDEVRKRWGFSA